MLRPYIVIVGSARVPERPQKLPVPRRRDPFARGVGAGLVGPRGDPRVALLADVPILPVGLVPEAHGIVGIEARLPEGVGVEQPLAGEIGRASCRERMESKG